MKRLHLSLLCLFVSLSFVSPASGQPETEPSPIPSRSPAPESPATEFKQPIGSISVEENARRTGVLATFRIREGIDPSKLNIIGGRALLNEGGTRVSPLPTLAPFKCKADLPDLCISIQYGQVADTIFSLQPRWKSFLVALDYSYEGRRDTTPFLEAKRTGPIVPATIKRQLPVWFNNSGQGKEIAQVMFTSDVDFKAKILLFRKGTSGGEDLLIGQSDEKVLGSTPTLFSIKQVGDTSMNASSVYRFEVKRSIEDLGIDVGLVEADSLWTPGNFSKRFTITNESTIGQMTLNDRNLKEIQVELSDDVDDLNMSLNGLETTECTPVAGSSQRYACALPEGLLLEGVKNLLVFEGTSRAGLPLEGTRSYRLMRSTRPTLEGGLQIATNKSGLLTIIAKSKEPLGDRDMELRVQAGSQSSVSDVRLGFTKTCQPTTCTFSIAQTDNIKSLLASISPLNQEKRVNLQISLFVGRSAGGSFLPEGPPIGAVTMELVQLESRVAESVEQRKLEIEKLQERVADNKVTGENVNVELRKVLNIQDPNQRETDAINYLAETLKSQPKNKSMFLNLGKFVGNVALAYFGVPIRL